MVDFAKIRAENKAKITGSAKSLHDAKVDPDSIKAVVPPKPRAEGRDRDEDKAMLGDLLGAYRGKINDWEKNFCESCLNFLLKYPMQNLSVKQAAVLDKTWAKYVEDSSPRPAIADKPLFGNRPKPMVFDDMDDDIPF